MRAAQVLWKNGTTKSQLMKEVFATVKNNPAPVKPDVQRLAPDTKLLVYRTYNPSLTKDDFQSLVSMISDKAKSKVLMNSFDVFKYRDPKFFTFLDRYILRFPTNHIMKEYLMASRLSLLDDRAVKFKATDVDSLQQDYARYYRNLVNASKSGKAYFDEVKNPVPKDLSVNWSRLQTIEHRSLLVWNLPENWDHLTVFRKFWWYDIHHSFQVFVNYERNTRLTFIHFNNVRDACLFRNNFHGALVEDNRLLIEKL